MSARAGDDFQTAFIFREFAAKSREPLRANQVDRRKGKPDNQCTKQNERKKTMRIGFVRYLILVTALLAACAHMGELAPLGPSSTPSAVAPASQPAARLS